MTATKDTSELYRSSTGHAFAASDWLDVHITAMQPEYEEISRLYNKRR